MQIRQEINKSWALGLLVMYIFGYLGICFYQQLCTFHKWNINLWGFLYAEVDNCVILDHLMMDLTGYQSYLTNEQKMK